MEATPTNAPEGAVTTTESQGVETTTGLTGDNTALEAVNKPEKPSGIAYTDPKPEEKTESQVDEANKTNEVKETTTEDEAKANEADESDSETSEQTSNESLGYPELEGDAQVASKFAQDLNIPFDTLKSAVVDGELDVSKLGTEIASADALRLKTVIDSTIKSMKAQNAEKRAVLEGHAGGKEAYDAMCNWANAKVKTDAQFKEQVVHLRNMMKVGGLQGQLAVEKLMNQFKSDPSTSYTPSTTVTTGDSHKDKGDALDKAWEAFGNKHKNN